MCVDSVCDCVKCVIGLWLDVFPVCVFYLYVVHMRVGSSCVSLGGVSDKKCRAAKSHKLTEAMKVELQKSAKTLLGIY